MDTVAYHQGYDLGYESKLGFHEGLEKNPYQKDQKEYSEWAQGYRHGFTDWIAE